MKSLPLRHVLVYKKEFMIKLFFFYQALRQLRQISQEISQPNVTGWGRRPAALRALGQRLSRLVT